MASFSQNDDSIMAQAAQQSSLYQFHQHNGVVGGHSGVIPLAAEEKVAHGLRGSSITSTSLKRKHCRDSFLVWVAYNRKRALNTHDPQQRTCPLVGCERDFANPELMQEHVYECLPLSRGLYRCFECGHEERIGKYHNKGCKGFHQSKGSFAKVANSLRLAKRLFSGQALKRRPQTPQPQEVPALGIHKSVLDTEYHPSELESNWYGNPVELDGEYFPELEDLGSSMSLSADDIFERGMLSELSNGCGTHALTSPGSEQYRTAELEDRGNPETTSHNPKRSQHRESCWQPSQHDADSETGKPYGYTHSDNRSPSVKSHDIYHALHQSLQTMFSHEADRGTAIDEIVSPISPADDKYPSSDTAALSPATQSLGNYSPRPASLTASAALTRDSSLSLLDSSVQSIEECRLPTTPWLNGFGSEMICVEPGDIDSVQTPEAKKENTAFDNSYPWYTGPSGFIFDCNLTSPPKPLNITKQYVHPEMYHFQLDPSSSPPPSSPPLSTPTNSFQLSPNPQSPGPKYRCICGHVPGGKEENKASNLKRHQRTCNMCTGTTPHSPQSYTCDHPHCGLQYNRSDNLLAHQRLKKHSRDFELHYIPVSPLQSESRSFSFEVDSREVQPKRRKKA